MTENKSKKKEFKKISSLLTLGISLVALGVGFGLGIFFQKNQKPNFRAANGQFQMGERTLGNRNNQNNQLPNQNRTSGEVTKVEDSSITVKTANGGSKLILVSDSTTYKQLTDIDKSQLQIGSQITIEGESNTDGSFTGKTVSIN